MHYAREQHHLLSLSVRRDSWNRMHYAIEQSFLLSFSVLSSIFAGTFKTASVNREVNHRTRHSFSCVVLTQIAVLGRLVIRSSSTASSTKQLLYFNHFKALNILVASNTQ